MLDVYVYPVVLECVPLYSGMQLCCLSVLLLVCVYAYCARAGVLVLTRVSNLPIHRSCSPLLLGSACRPQQQW